MRTRDTHDSPTVVDVARIMLEHELRAHQVITITEAGARFAIVTACRRHDADAPPAALLAG